MRDHRCQKCGTRFQSVEIAAACGIVGKFELRPPRRRVRNDRIVPVKLETIDEALTDAILTLQEVRDRMPTAIERAGINSRIEQLRNRLAAEYRQRGLKA